MTIIRKNKTRTQFLNLLLLGAAGLFLNYVLAQLVLLLGLPLYLDNIGSVLVAVLGGPLAGMTVGFVSNVTNSLTDPITLYYGILTVFIALTAAVFSQKGWFCHVKGVLCAAGIFAVIGGAIGSCMTWMLYGGGIGEGISAPYARKMLELGLSEFWAQFAADMLIDIPDKLITTFAVYGIVKHYPKKLYDRFPYSYLYDRSAEERDEAIFQRRNHYRKYSVNTRILTLIIVCLLSISSCSTVVSIVLARQNMREQYEETIRLLPTATGESSAEKLAAEKSAAEESTVFFEIRLRSMTLSYIIRMIAIQFGLSILIMAYAAWYAKERLVAPINSIVDLSREFGRTDPEKWLESPAWKNKEGIHTGDEIEELYQTICQVEEGTVRNVEKLKHSEELERMNQQLAKAIERTKEANQAKSTFLSRMSHDIRTPLNVIIGMSKLAKENDNPADTQECLEKITLSSQFLLGLVNDILDMERIESGKIQLHLTPYLEREFRSYIDTVIRPLCEDKGISFVYEAETPQEMPVLLDKLRINQIFFNLLSNAVKFTPEGGQIELHLNAARKNENQLEIYALVSDNGIGMSEEFQKHMFETFTQENQVMNSVSQGSGLGLAIVRQMCELMGIRISVKSTLGEGTIYQLYGVFTLAGTEAVKTTGALPDNEEMPVSLKNKSILICEDHMLNQEIIRRVLQNYGMIPVIAENGQKGLEIFMKSAPGEYAAVLMDIRMPVMDGLETSAAIRALPRADAQTVPIIAMSANAYAEDIQKSMEAGMNAHLSKPVDNKLLLQTLETWIQEE